MYFDFFFINSIIGEDKLFLLMTIDLNLEGECEGRRERGEFDYSLSNFYSFSSLNDDSYLELLDLELDLEVHH